jgi:precorrin-2/cobalt-factor-2 C20-methyltransferase
MAPTFKGRIICAGLGPGDPDLMSVKARRAVENGNVVAYFRKAGRAGQARRIVDGLLKPGVLELAMEYPVTTELAFDGAAYNDALAGFYDHWAARLRAVAKDQDVVVLCEGDPFFYGSFMHLYSRLRGDLEIEIIPGITGMSGCWTATGEPITWGDDVLSVLMGTLPEDILAAQMQGADALVVMKTGRNLPKIRRALHRSGRLDAAWLVESGTMPGQKVMRLTEVEDEACPYFAIVMVHGHGRRPEVLE